jgi:hypothetical protein
VGDRVRLADIARYGRGSTPSGPLGRLTTSGVNFLDQGKPWKYRAVTAFTLLQDALQGNDQDEFLSHVHEWGANTVRVFGMWSVTGFDPRWIAPYYDMLDWLCDQLAHQGLRLHFVAFTDQVPGSSVLMSEEEQADHVQRVANVLSWHDNALLELVNEDWKNGAIAG